MPAVAQKTVSVSAIRRTRMTASTVWYRTGSVTPLSPNDAGDCRVAKQTHRLGG